MSDNESVIDQFALIEGVDDDGENDRPPSYESVVQTTRTTTAQSLSPPAYEETFITLTPVPRPQRTLTTLLPIPSATERTIESAMTTPGLESEAAPVINIERSGPSTPPESLQSKKFVIDLILKCDSS